MKQKPSETVCDTTEDFFSTNVHTFLCSLILVRKITMYKTHRWQTEMVDIKVTMAVMRYFVRSFVRNKYLSLTWQVVFKLEYLFY